MEGGKMKLPVTANGLALGLAALLVLAGSAPAQQDTARAGMGMRRGHGMGMMMGQQMGRGMRMGGMHAGMRDRIGPPILLGLKEELGLSDEQVNRLEKIREEHRARVKSQTEKLREQRKTYREARVKGDWQALERLIDESARLRADLAKEMLRVERQSLAVLTDAQRQKVETWREGARLLGKQRMMHRQQMRMQMRGRGGMMGRGMHGRGGRPDRQ
jgi:Spy/CpxP family protein refolding chaperone